MQISIRRIWLTVSLTLCTVFLNAIAHAQTKDHEQVKQTVIKLHQAIFTNKDSLALKEILAKEINYGHSGGKCENREEMIQGVLVNKSTYTQLQTDFKSIILHKKVALVRCTLTATETKADGTSSPLKLNILLTLIKEKKYWKIFGRQSVKAS